MCRMVLWKKVSIKNTSKKIWHPANVIIKDYKLGRKIRFQNCRKTLNNFVVKRSLILIRLRVKFIPQTYVAIFFQRNTHFGRSMLYIDWVAMCTPVTEID